MNRPRDLSGRVRFFKKPEWADAKKKAMEKAEKFKRTPTSDDVNKAYFTMLGSIEREGKNMPIQGSNASIAKIALGCGFDKNGKPFMWHLLPQFDVKDENGNNGRATIDKKVFRELEATAGLLLTLWGRRRSRDSTTGF